MWRDFNPHWNESEIKPLFIYDWRGKPSHWGYPFDISQSVYQVSLLQEIYLKHENKIRIPNDLEALGVQYVYENYGEKQPKYMMMNTYNYGACADINRTQDLYQNKVAGDETISVESLGKLYKEGSRIDWSNYWDFVPNDCFIGTQQLKIK
jgi:hypothetical protein